MCRRALREKKLRAVMRWSVRAGVWRRGLCINYELIMACMLCELYNDCGAALWLVIFLSHMLCFFVQINSFLVAFSSSLNPIINIPDQLDVN